MGAGTEVARGLGHLHSAPPRGGKARVSRKRGPPGGQGLGQNTIPPVHSSGKLCGSLQHLHRVATFWIYVGFNHSLHHITEIVEGKDSDSLGPTGLKLHSVQLRAAKHVFK